MFVNRKREEKRENVTGFNKTTLLLVVPLLIVYFVQSFHPPTGSAKALPDPERPPFLTALRDINIHVIDQSYIQRISAPFAVSCTG